MDSNCAKIVFIDGEYAGAELELVPYAEIKFGRNPDMVNFVFSSIGVSREHCVIQFNPRDGRFRVTDLSSSGTYINSIKRMEEGSTEYIRNGETLKIGHSDNVIQLMAPSGADNRVTDVLNGDDKTVKLRQSGGIVHQGRRPKETGEYNENINGNGSTWVLQDEGNEINSNTDIWSGEKAVSDSQSDVIGYVALILAGIAGLVALVMFLCVCAGALGQASASIMKYAGVDIKFSYKCALFYFFYGWIVWLIVGVSIVALIMGGVHMCQTSGDYNRPRWLGITAIVCASVAILLMIIIIIGYCSTLGEMGL